ncbi:MAG: hypothetical protein ACKVT1_01295 [Dehalococcoidia bacterium]
MPSEKVNSVAAWLRGNALAEEAQNVGIPVVAARPRETLLARVRAALGA